MKTAFLLFFILMLFATNARSQQSFNSLNVKDLSSNKITVTSTTQSSRPCPSMTTAQRDLISSPVSGSCIYNTSTLSLNVYNGTTWKAAGGGVNKWATATPYQIDDVVIESNKFYIALTNHTSGTFATDLAASRWQILNAAVNLSTDATGVLPLANGGTNKNLTAVNGGVVYTDADSQEVSAAGTSNQILQSNGAAAPTWSNRSVLAQNQAGADVTLEEIQAPNLSLTQTATNTHLLETGNKNILQNASFEHSTVLTGWTSGAGTTARETTIEIDGDASLKVTLSSQALSISQDSTRYQAQFADGVDGLVGAWVKTSVSNIYVCARAAGASLVSSTFSNCVAVQNNNKWAFYQVPTILGATSNGVEVASYNSSGVSVAVTGDVYIDDAIVGAFPTRQTVDQSRIAGESYFAGTASCLWPRSTTTIGSFTTVAACPGPTVVTSTMGEWQTTDSNLPRQTINNLPAGRYKATFLTQGIADGGGSFLLAINDGTTTCEPQYFTTLSSGVSSVAVSCTFNYTSSANRIFELYGASSSSNANIYNNLSSPRASTKFILEYFGNSSIYSASCGANCVDDLRARISTTGAVSDENVEWINGNCSVSDTSLYTCTLTNTKTANYSCAFISESTNRNIYLTSQSTTQVVFRARSASADTNGTADFQVNCGKTGADFTASRTIVGSFKETMTAPGVVKPKTCYYAFGGASATLAAPTECTTGTCTEVQDSCGAVTPPSFVTTGIYGPVTFASGTFANSSPINCTCQGYSTSNNISRLCYPYFSTGNSTWSTNSSGGVTLPIITYSTSLVGANAYVQVKCEGQAP